MISFTTRSEWYKVSLPLRKKNKMYMVPVDTCLHCNLKTQQTFFITLQGRLPLFNLVLKYFGLTKSPVLMLWFKLICCSMNNFLLLFCFVFKKLHVRQYRDDTIRYHKDLHTPNLFLSGKHCV